MNARADIRGPAFQWEGLVGATMHSNPALGRATRNRACVVLLVAATALLAGAGGFAAGRSPVALSNRAVAIAADAPAMPATADATGSVRVTPAALQNMGLHFATAEMRPLVRIVRAPGVVAFNDRRMAQLTPPARGRVESIEVAVGEPVQAGQRLALLDNYDLGDTRSRIAAAQAALAQAMAEADAARAAYTRAVEVLRFGGGAQSEVERRRAEMARADAAIRTRQAELQQWKEMEQRQMPARPQDGSRGALISAVEGPVDSRAVIVAPFAGVIHSIGATPGELVDSARQLFSLVDLSNVWVVADVAEHDLGAVMVGEAVSLHVDAYPGRTFTGQVAYIPDQIDPRSGTARVRCDVPNPDGALRANMFVTADIQSPLGRDGIMVPDAAVQTIDGKPAIFVPVAHGKFRRHFVRLGLYSDGFVEILEGLAADAAVVTDGSFWLKAKLTESSIPNEG
ncbi:MAG: efflux RND transporter periplasmic adaptor subunit [Alphaproteobacteria bacterium]|nr:efflux RND transporter periplasmic adaptor subunit [Alphaproteobacteria bacterium]